MMNVTVQIGKPEMSINPEVLLYWIAESGEYWSKKKKEGIKMI